MAKTLQQQMSAAILAGDTECVKKLIRDSPDLIQMTSVDQSWLHWAAKRNNVPMIETLVDAGIDVNVVSEFTGTPLDNAVSNGCLIVAEWLLVHGANPNCGGDDCATTLASAAIEGSVEMVALLLKHGAKLNTTFGVNGELHNALSQAMMYGNEGVADFLRSQGAELPIESSAKNKGAIGRTSASLREVILAHVANHLGKPQKLVLKEIVSGAVPIDIHVVPPSRRRPFQTLVTTGMSEKAMKVPKGAKESPYAELLMHLPTDWPLKGAALKDPNTAWPFEWLRRIANYPFEEKTYLRIPTIISNEEPPRPLAPNTLLTSFLLLVADDIGTLETADGRTVTLFSVIPLYTEERDLERKKGAEHLLELFSKQKISEVIDPQRSNAAVPMKKLHDR